MENKKVGILVFYVNVRGVNPEDVQMHFERIVKDLNLNSDDPDNPFNSWEYILLPVQYTENRIQVIRNDGQSDIDEIMLSELKEKLLKYEGENDI